MATSSFRKSAAGRSSPCIPGSVPGMQPAVIARGLEKPNGLAFRGSDLYIATWSGVVIIPDYPKGIGSPRVLFDDMPRNDNHNARALALASDGTIYISSGSDCNVCTEQDPRLATILRYPAEGTGGGIFASGLRNASGLAIDRLGRLWAVVNQRDNLTPDHTDLPPDELDLVKEGGNYGWPTCYPVGNTRMPNPEFGSASCAGMLPTKLNFQAHSAPLQALFYEAAQFPRATVERSSPPSTAPGIASRPPGTRWSPCCLRTAGQRAWRTSLRVGSRGARGCSDVPSGWQSPPTARSTSATTPGTCSTWCTRGKSP